jgi:hypothetical protein
MANRTRISWSLCPVQRALVVLNEKKGTPMSTACLKKRVFKEAPGMNDDQRFLSYEEDVKKMRRYL